MFRVAAPSTSAAGVVEYFDKHLGKGDYYLDGSEHEQGLPGDWRGEGAAMLGLENGSLVGRESFRRLANNLHPRTGEQLTARMDKDRRVGWDMSFNAPKSVSLLYQQTKDPQILEAFIHSARETMEQDVEPEIEARVRKGRANQDVSRTSGNAVWGEFVHFTARPVDGIPDPNLHVHNYMFNATHDETEGQWKAVQMGGLDRPFIQARFHSRLAGQMRELGYGIDKSGPGWEWDIAGVPRELIEKFSRRTDVINAKADELGIISDKGKDQLGARTREAKRDDLSIEELEEIWSHRLTEEETRALETAKGQRGNTRDITPKEALDFALEHSLERLSTVREKELLTHAYHYAIGSIHGMEVERFYQELHDRSDVIVRERHGEHFVTTHEVRAEEQRMISLAREGRDNHAPLGSADEHVFIDPLFQDEGKSPEAIANTAEQKAAVLHTLSSRDWVIDIHGVAGAGKTTMMQEAIAAIESGGHQVFTIAPTSAATDVLKEKGFPEAQTMQRMLLDQKLQERLQGNVLWLDESGAVGTREMLKLFEVAKERNARVIFSGDTRQIHSVPRGDALRTLQTEGAVKSTELTVVQRQKNEAYRDAVTSISQGDIAGGFDQLDALGWIRDGISTNELHAQLAQDYLRTVVEEKRTAIVMSPTHREGAKVTELIRQGLRELPEGHALRLSGRERHFVRHVDLGWTLAQRGDARNYREGQLVHFFQNVKGGITKGDRYVVRNHDGFGNVIAESQDGRQITLPLGHGDRFSVFETGSLALSAGDKVRITQNGQTLQDKAGKTHRLNNGSVYDVAGFTREGDIRLRNGWVIDRNYGNLASGFVTTIDSAQGADADRAFLAVGSQSMRPADANRFYSAVTRGKESVTIYTDDKDMLKRAAVRSGERLSATELARQEQEAVQRERKEKAQRYTELVNRLRTTSRDDESSSQERPEIAGQWAQREQERRRVREQEMERGA